jgi:hypothetical protein
MALAEPWLRFWPMADFISRIIPFLPKSLQSEELADAASNFNRFSQLLAYVPNDHVSNT